MYFCHKQNKFVNYIKILVFKLLYCINKSSFDAHFKKYKSEYYLCLQNLKRISKNEENVISLYSTKFARFTSKPFYSLVITFNSIYFVRMFDFLTFFYLDKGNILFLKLFTFGRVLCMLSFEVCGIDIFFSKSVFTFFNEVNFPRL